MKLPILFFLIMVSITLISGTETCPSDIGYCNPNIPFLNPTPTTTSSINYSDVNVNNSQYLQGFNWTSNEWYKFWYNHTLATYNLYNAIWSSTYNATYAGLINNASYLSTYNATYDAKVSDNVTWNESYANTKYAKYNFTNNNFNGSGNFTTTDIGTFGTLIIGGKATYDPIYVLNIIGQDSTTGGVLGQGVYMWGGRGKDGGIASQGGFMQFLSGRGGDGENIPGPGFCIAGKGGDNILTGGVGGDALQGTNSNNAGAGGTLFMYGGTGGDAGKVGVASNTAGTGSDVVVYGGAGGGIRAGTDGTGGNGGSISFTGGMAGSAVSSTAGTGGNGGTITFLSGDRGTGNTANGLNGNIIFQSAGYDYEGVFGEIYFNIDTAGSYTALKLDTNKNVLIPNDNEKLMFGSSQQSSIKYNSSDMLINPKETGTGKVYVQGKLDVSNNTITSTQNITPSTTNLYSIGTSALRYSMAWLNGLNVLGNANITGNLIVGGNFSAKRPYWNGYYNGTDNFINTANAQRMNLSNNLDYDSYLISINSSQAIKFQLTGDYLCIVSPEFFQSGGGSALITFWMRKNGVDVKWSNSRYTIANNAYNAPAIPFQFDIDNPATDYIEFYWWSDSTNSQLYSSGALTSPTRPSIPAVITNCQKISELTP